MMHPYHLLLVFIVTSVAGEAVSQTENCTIERIEIQEIYYRTSEFSFKIIYNLGEGICYGKVPSEFEFKLCEGHGPYDICNGTKERVCQIGLPGNYSARMNDRNISECFSMPGLWIKPETYMTLKDTGIRLSIKPDQRVKYWNLTGYETSPVPDACSDKRGPHEFTEIFTEQLTTGVSEIDKPWNFSLDKCYCFKLRPEGYGKSLIFRNDYLNFPCRPLNTKPQPPKVTFFDQKGIITVLAAIASLLTVFIIHLIVTALNRRPEKIEPSPGKPLQRSHQDVLVIYAKEEEPSHLKQVDDIIRTMRFDGKSKIYDIHKHISEEFLADCNNWLWQRLERDRVLLVLSHSLKKYLNVIFSSEEETSGMKPLLVYGLKMIIGRNDYSKIFVVSFSSEDIREEDEDYSNIITRGRRYRLPEHLEELKSNLLTVKSSET